VLHTLRTSRATSAIALALALIPGAASWGQAVSPAAPAPLFPPGPDYAGVYGSPEENARVSSLCGANRNAKDGYHLAPTVAGQTKAPIVKASANFTVEKVAELDRSMAITFLPDGKMLVPQRAGGMRTIDAKGVVSEPLKGAPAIQQSGLSAASNVVLDKDFAKNRTLYYGYTAPSEGSGKPLIGKIVRARLAADDTALEDLKTIYEQPDLVPRRIVQARDGTLLIPSAEVASGGPNPQSMQNPRGKILRIATDGSIPKNNPFLADKDANPAFYALGFRDIQGEALDPKTGELWVAENTPQGGDELNRIKAGGNYGFPVISYGRENGGGLINGGKSVQAGMEQPVYYWNPSIAPSGMTFYDGKAFPAWKGSVFIGAMSGRQLVRLSMKAGKVVGEEKLLTDRCKRTKDVSQGPDGLIYVVTDEKPSEILRLVPKKPGVL
jgi:glucose/arabinose dehydrogenase